MSSTSRIEFVVRPDRGGQASSPMCGRRGDARLARRSLYAKWGRRSLTMYATINAAGKKIRLKMKYPRKLCPLRPATRAGQKAIATHTMTATSQNIAEPNTVLAMTSPYLR